MAVNLEENEPLTTTTRNVTITASSSNSNAFEFWKHQTTFEEENQTLLDGTPRGLVGLYNQGNSCYMNAGIQALSNCPPLREYFRHYLPSISTHREIPSYFSSSRDETIKQRKPVSEAFQDLLTKIWSQKTRGNPIAPTLFGYRIKERCPQFRGFTQQDAQEFIRCFLDILHQELKHVLPTKEEVCKGDGDGKVERENSLSSSCSSSQDDITRNEHDRFETADSGLSSDAGDSKPETRTRTISAAPRLQSTPEKPKSPTPQVVQQQQQTPPKVIFQHSRSIITDVFDGELVSTIKCMTCHHLSHTKETFQDISLSIPSPEQIAHLRESPALDLESSTLTPSISVTSSNSTTTEMEPMDVDVDSESANVPSSNNTSKQVALHQFNYVYWLFFFAKSWLIDSWLNYFLYAYRFMFSSYISLEDCLHAFFSADHLYGEDMYSCEKCSKLRNGLKQCRVTKLPEILCIHLKRFRHELLYNSKVGTRVTFPLSDLDMSPFVAQSVLKDADPEEFSAEYELVAFVSHRGAGAEFGHYVAFCRNAVDSGWYEFDDSYVCPVSEAEVMSREAYVLFYQKKGTNSNEQFKEKMRQVLNNLNDDPFEQTYLISAEWLYRYRHFSDPGPITNIDFLDGCAENPNQTVAIPSRIWKLLHERYGGGPEIAMSPR